jgi:hypothetical protein
MTGTQNLVELGLSLGFKIADETDPIYDNSSTVSVNPSSLISETPLENQEQPQGSA